MKVCEEETARDRIGEEEVPTRGKRLAVDDADRVVAEGSVGRRVGNDPAADQARGGGNGLRILGRRRSGCSRIGVEGGDGDEALLTRQVDDGTRVGVRLAVLELTLERGRIHDDGVTRRQDR